MSEWTPTSLLLTHPVADCNTIVVILLYYCTIVTRWPTTILLYYCSTIVTRWPTTMTSIPTQYNVQKQCQPLVPCFYTFQSVESRLVERGKLYEKCKTVNMPPTRVSACYRQTTLASPDMISWPHKIWHFELFFWTKCDTLSCFSESFFWALAHSHSFVSSCLDVSFTRLMAFNSNDIRTVH